MNYKYEIKSLKNEDQLTHLISGWDGAYELEIIEINLKTKKKYHFYINELKSSLLPSHDDYKSSFIRVREWLMIQHPEWLI